MGDLLEQRHGTRNEPGGVGYLPGWMSSSGTRLRPLDLVKAENHDGLSDQCHVSG